MMHELIADESNPDRNRTGGDAFGDELKADARRGDRNGQRTDGVSGLWLDRAGAHRLSGSMCSRQRDDACEQDCADDLLPQPGIVQDNALSLCLPCDTGH
jgi:hypothetical protein